MDTFVPDDHCLKLAYVQERSQQYYFRVSEKSSFTLSDAASFFRDNMP